MLLINIHTCLTDTVGSDRIASIQVNTNKANYCNNETIVMKCIKAQKQFLCILQILHVNIKKDFPLMGCAPKFKK